MPVSAEAPAASKNLATMPFLRSAFFKALSTSESPCTVRKERSGGNGILERFFFYADFDANSKIEFFTFSSGLISRPGHGF